MTTNEIEGYTTLKVEGFEGCTLVTYLDVQGNVHPIGAYDDAFAEGLERVRHAHLGTSRDLTGETGTPSAEALSRGAESLHAASPGPTTLLRCMWAAHRGEPQPADESFPVSVPDDVEEAEFIVGSLTVHAAEGRWLYCDPRPVEITVALSYRRGGLVLNPQGEVEFYPVQCNMYLDPATWTEGDGLLYDDNLIQDEVNDLLASRGLGEHRVTWSEQGRQDPMVADMDVDGRIALKLWPDLVAAEIAGEIYETWPRVVQGPYRVRAWPGSHVFARSEPDLSGGSVRMAGSGDLARVTWDESLAEDVQAAVVEQEAAGLLPPGTSSQVGTGALALAKTGVAAIVTARASLGQLRVDGSDVHFVQADWRHDPPEFSLCLGSPEREAVASGGEVPEARAALPSEGPKDFLVKIASSIFR